MLSAGHAAGDQQVGRTNYARGICNEDGCDRSELTINDCGMSNDQGLTMTLGFSSIYDFAIKQIHSSSFQ